MRSRADRIDCSVCPGEVKEVDLHEKSVVKGRSVFRGDRWVHESGS